MKPEERIEKLKAHKQAIETHRKELRRLMEECPHNLRPLTPKELGDEWMSVSAYCDVCQTNFGWRCKESPDGVCHYFSEHTDEGYKVTLIDLAEVLVPAGHDPDYETEDGCIYCGHPSERK